MPPSNPERLRQSWQFRELSGKPAQVWLIVRRAIATILAIGLIGYCGYLIFGAFWVPKSYLVYWSANAYQPLSAGPVKYACQDFAAIDAIKDNFAHSDLVDPADNPLTKELLEEKIRGLAQLKMRSKDTCVIFLTAHGGVRDKKPFLLCEPGDRTSEMPVSHVLDALKNVSAGTKLLVLDAGREDATPRREMAINDTFPALLQKALKEANDTSLWVLCANAPLERSHVSPALGRSIFGYEVSQGLRGAADPTKNHMVQLDELYNYVQGAVSARVTMATSSHESQTPQLYYCDAEKIEPNQLAARRLVSTKKILENPIRAAEHVAEAGPEPEGERGAFSDLLEKAGGDAKGLLPTEEIEKVSEIFGIHGKHEGGEGGSHGEHAGEAAGANEGQSESEKVDTAHDAAAKARSAARTESAANTVQQLKKTWQEIAKLESTGGQPSPSMMLPPLWRELLDRLLWCDRFCTAGVPVEAKAPWKQVAKQLETINTDLETYLEKFSAYRASEIVNIAPDQWVSFALVERLAAHNAKLLSRPLKEFVSAYDGLLAQSPPASSKEKLRPLLLDAQKKDLSLGNYWEFQLLNLNDDTEVSWNVLQLALRARRNGERVATNQLCGEGWSRATIEEADRKRGEGERLMLDRTYDDWEKLASDQLGAALAEYEMTDRNIAYIRSTIQERNYILLRSPDLVRWARLSGGEHQQLVAIKKVFESLEALNKELASPKDNIDGVKDRREQLQHAFAELEKKTDPANNAWRMANLLATALPQPDMRGKWAAELSAADEKQMASFKGPDSETEAVQISAPSEQQWKEASEELELEFAFARLAGYDEKSLEGLKKTVDAEKSKRIETLEEVRGSLAGLLDKRPESIVVASDSIKLDRGDQLQQLRRAMPHWLLLGPKLREQVDLKHSLAIKLDRLAWHDLLAWNRDRFLHAADDAPDVEQPFLRNATATYKLLAEAIPDEPALPTSSEPELLIEPASRVSLINADHDTLTFTVKSNANVEKPIWLIAQYNDKWLDVDSSTKMYRQHKLPAVLAAMNPTANASHYPLRPDALKQPASDSLPPNGSREYRLKITRQPNTDVGGTAKLILKAVSGETFVRRELAVDLPGREALDVKVNASPDFWTQAKRALHPLPNRVQKFTFNVVNGAKAPKKLDVAIFSPTNIPSGTAFAAIPTGAQRPETASKLLDPYGLVRLGPVIPIELPASSDPVRIKLADDPKNNPQTNLLLPDKADPEQYPGIPLRYGLIFLLTDQQTKEVTIRRIEISPQRPSGYLNAVAHYDRSRERLQIDVTAKNREVIPADGLQISADVTGVSALLPRSLKAQLKEPSFAATLYAQLTPTASPDITAYVNVDDYPRAFVFKFSRNEERRDIPPETGATEIRIVDPPPGKAYKAPVKALTVTAEVDAPTGTFGDEDATSLVEVGIDENQDRELQGEPVETRRADRQVTVTAKSFSADGSLALDTRVSDFHIDLKPGLTDRPASLLGRLTINGKTITSKPVEIIFDGSGPIVYPAVPPSREVESGDDLIVKIVTRPNEPDLSGIQTVEAVFDSIATKETKDAKPPKWEEAVPDGPTAWVAKLSTKDMGLGPQTVLVRATDKVGNRSEPKRDIVTIVPKPANPAATVNKDKENAKPDVANIVFGKVQYGGQPAGAKVALESIGGPQVPAVNADEKGSFKFPKVPPGKYTLKATTAAAIHNGFRKAEMEVTVEPLPQKPAPLTVNLK